MLVTKRSSERSLEVHDDEKEYEPTVCSPCR